MKKYTVSKALGGLSDDLLLEALEFQKTRQPAWKILRAAACLAAVIGLLAAMFWPGAEENIVIGPGILTVTVYAADATPYTISSPDTVLHKSIYSDGPASYAFGCPITLSVPEKYDCSENVTFQVAVDGGGMLTEVETGETFTPGNAYKYMPSQFSVPNHTTIRWTALHVNASAEEYSMANRDTAHVEITIYDGENIVGYSVLRLCKMTCSEVIKADPNWVLAENHQDCSEDHKTNCYRIEMLASVFYPKIDGEFQKVSDIYVKEQIEKVRIR